MNDLNVLVKEWFTGDGKAYARDYKLAFLAYYNTVAAPAKLKTGSLDEYEPVAPEVKADPEIAVIYAPIEGDFSRTIDDPNSTNTTIYHNMLKWSAVCDHLMIRKLLCALSMLGDKIRLGCSYKKGVPRRR